MRTVLAVLIFVATYAVVAAGRVPGLRIDRAGAAFLGGVLMVAAGALSLDQAYAAIDFDTVALLLGMMIVVANLRLAGFFALVTAFVVGRARHPLQILAGVVLTSGVLSAFLVNDTICLVLTPLVLDIVLHLRRDPVPYVLAIALASNIGSTATITGNPQNMIIGSLSHIAYGDFAASLAPVAALGLLLAFLLIALLWRSEFAWHLRLAATPPPIRIHGALIAKSLVVVAGLVAAFFAGVRPAEAALVAGALLLPSRAVKVGRMYADIDWTLLLMFAGLFVVVAGIERTLLTPEAVRRLAVLHLNDMPVLGVATALLSNLVSNVPAVLVLKPFITGLADPQRAWKVVAMAATLAGNFTLLGSVANLIVVQRARARGVAIGFWSYFAVGAPLTALSILAGLALL
ncbi:MAG: anion transporter [Rhodospirillales bacterium]|nr:anion transporter [Rhodospirillales bacterium]MDE2199805.1 anion transporter [Rhodospirillales bacterium]MDE2575408.1 anion transporter [Rhodospirillales bacterium]